MQHKWRPIHHITSSHEGPTHKFQANSSSPSIMQHHHAEKHMNFQDNIINHAQIPIEEIKTQDNLNERTQDLLAKEQRLGHTGYASPQNRKPLQVPLHLQIESCIKLGINPINLNS